MKKIYLTLIFLALLFSSFAQTTNDIGKIALSVVMPEENDYLDFSHISKLETKVSQIVADFGLAAVGYNHNFIIYPKFTVYESNTVEGGMKNITLITAELSLFIEQNSNSLLFSAITIPLNGSGSSKKLAITNAIGKINTSDPAFKTFIETGKLRITSYYESKCTDIIKQSDSYVQKQQYEQALALLMSFPEEVSSCYNQIQSKSIEVYKAYQTQICAELIQQAKTTLASNNYVGALDVLSNIDPSASCFNEAQAIVNSIEGRINTEAKKRWDFKMKQYNDAKSLNVQRIEAIKEIAVSYYKSQPTIYYEY